MKLHSTVGVLAMALAFAAFSPQARAGEEKEETVTLAQVPAAVQEAVKAYASEAEIKKIEKGDVDGKLAYEFEIEKAGKQSEVTFLPNGKLLSTEEPVALTDVPEAARKTIEDQAAGGKIASTEKVVEKGKTVYEAVIEKDGKKREIVVSPKGKLVEEEKDEKAEKGEKKDKD